MSPEWGILLQISRRDQLAASGRLRYVRFNVIPMRRVLPVLLVTATALLAAQAQAPVGRARSAGAPPAERARNVILFIGDAGGLPTLNAASLYGYDRPQALFIQKMPNIALMDTSAANNWVTDSAAGMTAIVTGRKTNSGVLSQSDTAVRGQKDGEPLKTILEYAEERGLSTGVITNDSVAGATPAAGETPPANPPLRVDDGHTGEEVVVAAQGPGARRVHGFIANTDLFRIIMAAYGWTEDAVAR